jgi:hypothetical protein
MSLLFNLRPSLKRELDALQPTLGYCILVDIVDSTALKDQGLDVWPMRIFNTFSLVRNYIPQFRPLKSLGDSLMFYVRETDLKDRNLSALDLFLALSFGVQEEDKEIFGRTKVAAVYCKDAYEITFIHNTNDIYGKDVDLAGRFVSIALEGEIIMNESFVQQVRTAYEQSAIQNQFPDVPKIAGPWPQQFKGFSDYVSVYKLPAGGTSLMQHMDPSSSLK